MKLLWQIYGDNSGPELGAREFLILVDTQMKSNTI